MQEKILFKTVNNSIVDNYEIAKAAMIMTGETINYTDNNTIRDFAKNCKGIIEEMENPTIEEIAKYDKVKAIRTYYDSHPGVSFSDARIIIENMLLLIKN